jgi:hypothetical protein
MIVKSQYICFCFFCATSIFAVIASSCRAYDDAHTVRGALAEAARAVEADDRPALFQVIDRRSKAALISVVKDRTASARAIAADYPEPEREAALRSLGDAATVSTPEELFARRCDRACVAELGANLGAPVSEVPGPHGELIVQTAEGHTVRLFKGRDGLWGLVWRTQELFDERLRAAREKLQIIANAEVYRRRRQLEGAVPAGR